jgi:hypothetical protein
LPVRKRNSLSGLTLVSDLATPGNEEMMQQWSDYLDGLKAGAKVLPLWALRILWWKPHSDFFLSFFLTSDSTVEQHTHLQTYRYIFKSL